MDNKKERDNLSGYGNLLVDKPIEEVEGSGCLGFDRYKDALKRIIKEIEPPRFTVGIFGQWGTGKTTLMRAIEKGLTNDEEGPVREKDDIVCVRFNPWRYQDEDKLVIPLLKEIKKTLEEKDLKEEAEAVGEALSSFISGLRFKPPFVEADLGKIKEESQDLSEKLDSPFGQALDYLEKVGCRLRKSSVRLVVFIDDLDRCVPEKALYVLESIKTFFDIEGFIFVLGLDDRTIKQHIEGQRHLDGKEYLKKIVQLPFTLPSVLDEEIKSYIEDNLKEELDLDEEDVDISKYSTFISGGAENNPREVKRFINRFLLTKLIGKDKLENTVFLLELQILQFRWPDFYQLLTRVGESESKKKFMEEVDTYLEKNNEEELESDLEYYRQIKRYVEAKDVQEINLLKGFLHRDMSEEEDLGSRFYEEFQDVENIDFYFHFNASGSVDQQVASWKGPLDREEILMRYKKDLRSLREADLREADLGGANLGGAYLIGAYLKSVKNWQGVRSFKRTNIYGVKNISEEDKKYALEHGAIEEPPT